MAAKLETSFFQLEEKNETLDAVVNNLSEGLVAVDLEGVQHIRKKVEPDPQNPRYVLTVRGAGYKFADL